MVFDQAPAIRSSARSVARADKVQVLDLLD